MVEENFCNLNIIGVAPKPWVKTQWVKLSINGK